jgi:His-Xaa-Ser system radical SAM maturase HxsC
MIPLRIRAKMADVQEPTVFRLCSSALVEGTNAFDAIFVTEADGWKQYQTRYGTLHLEAPPHYNADGDVVLLAPKQKIAHRLIRASSPDNTLLVTEQCDQLCIMCSQPPKPKHYDLFDFYMQAVLLAPRAITIGLSGGEPTLHKRDLLSFLSKATSARPDLSFHILTNGQHFEWEDLETLSRLSPLGVVWGVPLYAESSQIHDEIVGKSGAFESVMKGLSILGQAGAAIELRTVILTRNAEKLASLATLIGKQLPFISTWAIMQLENIGYGKKNWRELFYDNSIDFGPIARALEVSQLYGQTVRLYNFPLCSIPEGFRRNSVRSISDWKRKYLELCSTCSQRNVCGGFFSWYDHRFGFENVRPE